MGQSDGSISWLAIISSTSSGTTPLYWLDYDNAAPPASGCGTTSNTIGHLQRRTDSFGQTWYSYDALGHVTDELRLRAGLTSCTDQLAQDVASTHYAFTLNGEITTVVYPFGRTVKYNYGTGGLIDRVSSVTTTETDGSTWSPTDVPVVSGVVWEPFGGIRAYIIDNQTACAPTYVNYRHIRVGTATDPHTGQLGSLTVGTTDGSSGPPAGTEIYHRDYTWTADQVSEIDTYLLGSATPRIEQYTYDRLLRLTDAVGPNFSAVGGSFAAHHYSYDGRGNRVGETGTGSSTSTANNCNPTLTYSSSHVDQLTGVGCSASGSFNSATYSYDSDGRVQGIQGPNYFGTSIPAWQLALTSGPDGTTTASGAEDSVYRSISIGTLTYGYFYDAFNRRRLKSYPADGVSDEFYYRVDNMLLSDIGNDDVTTPTFHPIDEYVWLGGRPIAVVRSRLKLVSDGSGHYNYVHDQDGTGSCMRNDDPQSCGIFDIITDHIGAPVLMLDGNQLVVGEGSMDPFGAVNSVSVDGETAHPYAANTNQTLATLTQPAWGTGTTTRLRARFKLVDADTAAGDTISFVDPDSADAVLSSSNPIGGARAGEETSGWLTPTSGRVAIRFSSTATSSGTPTGAVLAGYDYQRYQSGTSPTWVPLRYPGQYWDEETSLVQNWNRFYAPDDGRFIGPEPALVSPELIALFEGSGLALPSYSYASNNPLSYFDPDGEILVASDHAGQVLIDKVNADPEGAALIAYLQSSPNTYVVSGNAKIPGTAAGATGNALPGDTDYDKANPCGGTRTIALRIDSRKIRSAQAQGGAPIPGPVGRLAHEMLHAALYDFKLTQAPLPTNFLESLLPGSGPNGELDSFQHLMVDWWSQSHWGTK